MQLLDKSPTLSRLPHEVIDWIIVICVDIPLALLIILLAAILEKTNYRRQ